MRTRTVAPLRLFSPVGLSLAGLALAALNASAANAGDLALAPPSFQLGDETVVPIDITSLQVTYELDVGKSSALAVALLEFQNEREGLPLLDFMPQAESIELDGLPLEVSSFPEISVPPPPAPEVTTMRVLKQKLKPGSHSLRIRYSALAVPNKLDGVVFLNGGASLIYSLSDLSDRSFMETYVPSNFEYDQFPFRLKLRIQGQTATHEIYTNADLVEGKEGDWTYQFPDYFNTSAPFFYLTPNHKVFKKTEIDGVEIQVFSRDEKLTDAGLKTIGWHFPRYGRLYGPYPHKRFLAWITGEGQFNSHFGMEHAGATRSDLESLPHELLHSWFGRGVMPANGNAAWIDEGIAKWGAEKGGPASIGAHFSEEPAEGVPGSYSKYSPYRRMTDGSVYSSWVWFDSLDLWCAKNNKGSLADLLKAWLARAVHKTVSTQDFKDFVIEYTGDFGRNPKP
jgi:hypothetical protein